MTIDVNFTKPQKPKSILSEVVPGLLIRNFAKPHLKIWMYQNPNTPSQRQCGPVADEIFLVLGKDDPIFLKTGKISWKLWSVTRGEIFFVFNKQFWKTVKVVSQTEIDPAALKEGESKLTNNNNGATTENI